MRSLKIIGGMEAIIRAAEKKKDGTLYKRRVLKIAGSGVVFGPEDIKASIGSGYRYVYAIVGSADSDFDLTISCGDSCKPGDNEKWEKDFISTPREGLRIIEALKKITNN